MGFEWIRARIYHLSHYFETHLTTINAPAANYVLAFFVACTNGGEQPRDSAGELLKKPLLLCIDYHRLAVYTVKPSTGYSVDG